MVTDECKAPITSGSVRFECVSPCRKAHEAGSNSWGWLWDGTGIIWESVPPPGCRSISSATSRLHCIIFFQVSLEPSTSVNASWVLAGTRSEGRSGDAILFCRSISPGTGKRVGETMPSGNLAHARVKLEGSARCRIVPTGQKCELPGDPLTIKTNLRSYPQRWVAASRVAGWICLRRSLAA